MTTLHFPDVSHYQAGIDLSTAVAVIAKATEGTGMVDATYIGFKAQAAKSGAPFLAYHFLHHGNVAAQVDHVVATIGKGQSLMLDVESEEGMPDPTLSDVLVFADLYAQKSGGGRVVCGYIPKWFWAGHWGSPSLAGLTSRSIALISSLYTTYSDGGDGWKPYGGVTPSIWQYTASASFGGVSKVDFNAFKGTVDDLRRLWGLEGDMADSQGVQATTARNQAMATGVVPYDKDWTDAADGQETHWLVAQVQAHTAALARIEAALANLTPGAPSLIAHTHNGGETGPAVAS